MDKSPPGGREWDGAGEPTDNQLDFSLIRLCERAGADIDAGGTPRGHAQFDVPARSTITANPLIILEHPEGAPLQICLGSIVGANAGGTRLYHNATTLRM
jgi:hypothetical protein